MLYFLDFYEPYIGFLYKFHGNVSAKHPASFCYTCITETLPQNYLLSINRNVRYRGGNRHHYEDKTPGYRPYPHVTRFFVSNTVEDGKYEHHYDEREYPVHKEPYFVVVSPVAVVRRSCYEVADVID